MPPAKYDASAVKIHREALACTIYAGNVDLDKPLLNKAKAAAAFKAADDFIEYFQENERPTNEAFIQDLKETVKTMLQVGQKIAAIKEVRKQTGHSLKEAKGFVDTIERENKPMSLEAAGRW